MSLKARELILHLLFNSYAIRGEEFSLWLSKKRLGENDLNRSELDSMIPNKSYEEQTCDRLLAFEKEIGRILDEINTSQTLGILYSKKNKINKSVKRIYIENN